MLFDVTEFIGSEIQFHVKDGENAGVLPELKKGEWGKQENANFLQPILILQKKSCLSSSLHFFGLSMATTWAVI